MTGTESMGELAGYRLLEVLGEGGMARVYRAERAGPMGFRKVVAVKQILPHVSKEEKLMHALVNEARLGGFLKHRNVVEVYEFGQVGDSYFIAMEFVDGWTLDRMLRRCEDQGPLPPRIVLQIALQLCAGLEYAHAALDADGRPLNLVHRDLKPSNVIVARDGLVKIMDFGIARSESNVYRTHTASITKGTPVYMSPEQVMGESLDRRSDLFSLASVLTELVNGEVTFQGTQVYQVMQKVAVADVRQALARADSRIPGIGAVLERAYRKRPQDRYDSAVEFGHALTALYDRIPGTEQLGPFAGAWMEGESAVRPSAQGISLPARPVSVQPASSPTLSPPAEGPIPLGWGGREPVGPPADALHPTAVPASGVQVAPSAPALAQAAFAAPPLPSFTDPPAMDRTPSRPPTPPSRPPPERADGRPEPQVPPPPPRGASVPDVAFAPPQPIPSPGVVSPRRSAGGGYLVLLFLLLVGVALVAVAGIAWWMRPGGRGAEPLNAQLDAAIPLDAPPVSPAGAEAVRQPPPKVASPRPAVRPVPDDAPPSTKPVVMRSADPARAGDPEPARTQDEGPTGAIDSATDAASDAEAVEMLPARARGWLKGKDVGRRIDAVESLESLRGPTATRALRWVLRHDKHWKVQYQCVQTAEVRYRRFGDQGEIRLVESVVRESQYHPEVRTKAIRVLSHNCRGRASSIRAIEAGLKDTTLSAGLRDEMADALASLTR